MAVLRSLPQLLQDGSDLTIIPLQPESFSTVIPFARMAGVAVQTSTSNTECALTTRIFRTNLVPSRWGQGCERTCG